VVAATATFGVGIAMGAAGDLDPTFSGDGKVVTPMGSDQDLGRAVAIDSQGRIVIAGGTENAPNFNVAIARYRPNGALDTSFAGDGKVRTAIGASSDAFGVAIDSQDRIVIAGITCNGTDRAFALARYRPGGGLDPTFSGDGMVRTDFGSSDDMANAVAIDSQGRIVAGGSTGGEPADFAVARYRPNGSLDPEFSGDGKTTTHIRNSSDIRGVAVDSQDRVVAAGNSYGGGQFDFALARYRENGALDPDFSHDGTTITPFGGGNDNALDVAIDAENRPVAAGQTLTGYYTRFAISRYRINGSLDQSFSGDGRTTTSIGTEHDGAYGVVVDREGRTIAAGAGANGFWSDFALARYRPNGSLDPSFSGDGTRMTSFGPFGDSAAGVALGPGGKIVAAGTTFDGSQDDFAVARYQG
jgi:uncharacterized delta-60 repeat protein